MSERLKALADAGVSIWLDDLSRERLNSNNLAELVADSSVVGVTTNPTIFASALAKGEAYDEQMEELAARDASVEDAIKALTTDDVRNACDVLAATSAATHGVDGRVSIEVEPGLARDDRRHHRPGQGPVEDRRPAEPADQDPGHPSRACPPSPR